MTKESTEGDTSAYNELLEARKRIFHGFMDSEPGSPSSPFDISTEQGQKGYEEAIHEAKRNLLELIEQVDNASMPDEDRERLIRRIQLDLGYLDNKHDQFLGIP